ncbi:hypothetical protein C6P40_003565 [Pichia californica]|uniref:Carboxylic ester hydrolase n=1 Tax=Pichia californica TaxID=460514 RepID=A0A9P7BEI2_9ASCO|nr:hypothetical protein C6P42_003220 [[Candida] californica]KAG0686689.1 hypothetical protein C6P40_003565 [[Candida] californica]
MNFGVPVDGCPTFEVTIPNQGTLTGFTLKNPQNGNHTVHRFAKVPYALLSEERYSLPKSIPETFDYTGEYKFFGLKCPQPVYESKQLKYPKSPSDEYIQYSNIWVPSSNKYKPKNGWPVLIYIHGGWLQFGNPNNDFYDTVELMDDENFTDKYIFVTIGYRLNIFGFLTCSELIKENSKNTNMGFWDQREAIKWVHKYIKYFGGDPEKITLGGLSAGSYSTFFQLAYEAYNPNEQQIIKQVVLNSNMIFSQPKSIAECEDQYKEVINKLGINHLNSKDQLAKLRSYSYEFIEEFLPKLELHTFRAVTDNHFINSSILKDIQSGEFSKLLTKKNIRILHGEVDNEGYLYSLLDPPISFDDLATQIENYYPKQIVPILLKTYKVKEKIDLESSNVMKQFANLFGQIISDGQVYCSTRGFINNLIKNGFPVKSYFRYRISYRGKWMDKYLEPQLKVTHGFDKAVWFYTLRAGFTNDEKSNLEIFLKPYFDFLNFKEYIKDWDTSDAKKIRWFKDNGSISYEDDPDWKWGIEVADKVYKVQLEN